MKRLMVLVFSFSMLLPGLKAWAELSYSEIARELMSPACPGKLLIDCTSGEATQLKELIRQKIQQGQSKEEIINYFVEVYGEQILAAPPKKGFYLTAWTVPLVIIIYAALIVYLMLRFWRRRGTDLAEPRATEKAETYLDVSWKQKLEEELKDFQGF
jgi:cytochrome c-type biogenesis protein CcmH